MQYPDNSHTQELPEDELFSLKNESEKFLVTLRSALQFWRWILLSAILGIIISVAYRYWKPVAYSARITFVVEDSKTSGTGIMSALAGQFGLDLGNVTGGSGVLSGDNILALLKSHSLIRKTLLTQVDSSATKSLADLYAETYHWKEKWKNSSRINRQIDFPADKRMFTRLEDSLLQKITENILKKELVVAKIDRKLSFIEMQTTMRNETLSSLFCQRLLKTATGFYIETKTQRLTKNIQRLQAKADSLERNLNRKTYSAANANRLLLDANPVFAAPEVSAEISARDKFVQSTIYAEIIKNLEMNKTAQIQETPTIQVVDAPELPLPDTRIKLGWSILYGALFGSILCILSIMVLQRSNRRKNTYISAA